MSNGISKPAANLAKRAQSLAANGNGRYVLEIVVIDGKWYLVVNGSTKLEALGNGGDMATLT